MKNADVESTRRSPTVRRQSLFSTAVRAAGEPATPKYTPANGGDVSSKAALQVLNTATDISSFFASRSIWPVMPKRLASRSS